MTGRGTAKTSQDTPAAPAQATAVDARRQADRAADQAGRNAREKAAARGDKVTETGGPAGLEPTRYGDWEKAGRCIDF